MPVHKITAGLNLLPKFRLFLRKGKHFTILLQPKIEIPLTPYRAVEMFVPTLLFKWKIDRGLGSRSNNVAAKAVPGQAGADCNHIGETSHSVALTPLPAPFSGPSKEPGACKDLL